MTTHSAPPQSTRSVTYPDLHSMTEAPSHCRPSRLHAVLGDKSRLQKASAALGCETHDPGHCLKTLYPSMQKMVLFSKQKRPRFLLLQSGSGSPEVVQTAVIVPSTMISRHAALPQVAANWEKLFVPVMSPGPPQTAILFPEHWLSPSMQSSLQPEKGSAKKGITSINAIRTLAIWHALAGLPIPSDGKTHKVEFDDALN